MFFDASRENFFRPLHSRRRELVVSCLTELYARMYGHLADYSQVFTKETVRDILVSVIQAHGGYNAGLAGEADSELDLMDLADEQKSALAILNALKNDGWLESSPDSVTLVSRFRFTAAGRVFARTFYDMAHAQPRVQRNIRGCRSSLAAHLANGGFEELLDALEYSRNAVSDLTETVEHLQDMRKVLAQHAAHLHLKSSVGEFSEFYRTKAHRLLTSDSIDRYVTEIQDLCLRLRAGDRQVQEAGDAYLRTWAPWIAEQAAGRSPYLWLIDRIEQTIHEAYMAKQPELLSSVHDYVAKIESVARQSMARSAMLSSGGRLGALDHLANLDDEGRQRFIARLAEMLGTQAIRLVDPADVRLAVSSRSRPLPVSTQAPVTSREARLAAFVKNRTSRILTISVAELVDQIDTRLSSQGPFRLSELPLKTAEDVIFALHVVDAARTGKQHSPYRARRLDTVFETDYFSTNDYLIQKAA